MEVMWNLQDILILSVCMVLMSVYLSFLTYEWIKNKRKKVVEVNLKLSFVVPAAYKIYCILGKKVKFKLKEETLDRYKKLYVGKSEDDITKEFFIKHISLFLCTYLLFNLIVLFSVISCQSNQYIVSEYYIEKNDIGGEQKEISVQTEIGGKKKDTDIIVPERKYNEKEILHNAEKVKKYIYSHYLGNNKSPDKVTKNLSLVRHVNGSMFNISWTSSNENVVAADGKVECGKITEPENVELTAVLKYEQYKEKLKFNITVCPVKKTEEENIWDEWRKLFEKSVEDTKSFKYIKLPDKVRGKNVSYSVDRYKGLCQTAGIAMLMFVVVPIMAEYAAKNKVTELEKQLKLAYPEMVEKFVLLINAGLPVKNAWIRVAETRKTKNDKVDYLTEEMLLTKNQMDNGISEEKAYEMFGRRIGILTYMKFSTLLVQNLKKGTANLINILEYESADIFNERKENAKILGEEASTKLLVPMVLMMTIIFAIILYAAFAGM